MTSNTLENRSLNVKNVLRAFRHWPRIYRLLVQTHGGYLLAILVLNLTAGIVPVFALLANQRLINSIVTGWQQQSWHGVLFACLVFVLVSFGGDLLRGLTSYFEKVFESLLANRVNHLIMEKTIQLSLADFENTQVQDQLKRVQGDANSRPFQIMKQMLAIISGISTLCSSMMVVAAWKWWAPFAVLLIPLFSFLAFLRLGQKEFLLSWERIPKMREAWYLTYLLTRENSFKEVKLYRLGRYFLAQYARIMLGFFQEDKQMAGMRMSTTLLFSVLNLVIFSSLLFGVALNAFYRMLPIGNVVGLIQAIRLTESTSQSVVLSVLNLCHNNLYLEQLFAFLDRHSMVESRREAFSEKDSERIEPLQSIEFRRVTFRYPGTDKDVLRDVSFTIHRGETVAIVGKNGAGKSTLVKLLAQLYPDFEGDILINGRSIREIEQEEWLQQIGIVFQDFVQYEMPMRQNVGFGNLALMEIEDSLQQAAVSAGIEELVDQLPQRWDTHLGRWLEDGSQLSGGQWQRVAIARAFLRDAGLYVLDEPSSFLDPKAESEVFAKFRELVQNRMGIYISHRYSSILFSDRILLFDSGRIVEQGSHTELIKQEGMYAQLYNLQVSAFVKPESGGSGKKEVISCE